MMEEEFNEDEREYYSIELPIEGIRLVHKAFKIAVEKYWWRSSGARRINCYER